LERRREPVKSGKSAVPAAPEQNERFGLCDIMRDAIVPFQNRLVQQGRDA